MGAEAEGNIARHAVEGEGNASPLAPSWGARCQIAVKEDAPAVDQHLQDWRSASLEPSNSSLTKSASLLSAPRPTMKSGRGPPAHAGPRYPLLAVEPLDHADSGVLVLSDQASCRLTRTIIRVDRARVALSSASNRPSRWRH